MIYNLLSVNNLSKKSKMGAKAHLTFFLAYLSPFIFQSVARVDHRACVHTVPCC